MPCATGFLPKLALLLVASGSFAACGQCGSDAGPKVPFKLAPDDAGVGGADASTAPPVSASYKRDAGVSEVEGAKLPWQYVRATLAADVDQDGDRDVIALHGDTEGNAHLAMAVREDARFENARELEFFKPESELTPCTLELAELTALSGEKALLKLAWACGAPAIKLPGHQLLLSIETTPRVFEHITQRATADGRERFRVSVDTRDADADGHDDVVLTLHPQGFAEIDAPLQLSWLDRASGLVRDVREPENTLGAWASAARSLASKAPEQAAERANMVLTTRRALCRESGAPEVTFSGSPGLVCGRGKSEGDALLALAEAQAGLGEPAAALSAWRELKRLGSSVDQKALDKLETVLGKLPTAPGIMLHRGAHVEPLSAPSVHLPEARFLGEDSMLLQRREPVLYDLATGEESPSQVPTDSLVRDPSGQLAITAVDHTCSGYSLRIERAPALGEAYVRLPGASSVVLLPEANPPDCRTKPGQLSPGTDFMVLGWAPQGAVLARGAQVRVVPLDLMGKAAGEARALDQATPLPAPLPSGAASPDGARYVEATPFGVLVYAVRSGEIELWRPDGYLALGKRARKAAVSPSGRRVSVVADDTFYWLERAP